jgi:predicted DNA-binding transcriptional regulator AlpA
VEPEYDTSRILGTWEIAEMLGVTRSRVNQMALQRGFPKPYGVLHAGKIWRRADIEAWARRRNPPADTG